MLFSCKRVIVWHDTMKVIGSCAIVGALCVAIPSDFLESKQAKKVWHNYSFDRHVLYNHGINVQGLGGDTMHMARLWNTARFQNGGYSLEALSEDLLLQRKRPMKELFGIPKLKKDGSEGKERIMPTVEELQRFPEFRNRWIRYSVYDAESTWYLHRVLKHKLEQTLWYEEKDPTNDNKLKSGSMYDFYLQYIVPFGECLTDIERKGMNVDLAYLKNVEKMALEDRARLEQVVLKWASRYCEESDRINVYSAAQKQQLLFAPYVDTKKNPPKVILPAERTFEVENVEEMVEPGKQKAKKKRDITIKGLGIPPTHFTASGLPAASAEVLKDLAGKVATMSWPSLMRPLCLTFASTCRSLYSLMQILPSTVARSITLKTKKRELQLVWR